MIDRFAWWPVVKIMPRPLPNSRAKSRSSSRCSANVPFAIRDPVVAVP